MTSNHTTHPKSSTWSIFIGFVISIKYYRTMALLRTNTCQNAFGSSLQKVVSFSPPLPICSPIFLAANSSDLLWLTSTQSEARQVAGAIRFATDCCRTPQAFRLLDPHAFSQAQHCVVESRVESASYLHRKLHFPFCVVHPLAVLVSIMQEVHRTVSFSFTIFAFLSSTSAVASNTPLQLISTTDGNHNITIANDNHNNFPLPLSLPGNYSISNVSITSSPKPFVSYVCNTAFGSDLNPTSCEDAVGVVGVNTKVFSFALRDEGIKADVPLPQRFISSDGECVIEPTLETGATIARVSPEDIALAAFVITRNCAAKEPHIGGIAKDIGA